jgi:hypothetical protein
MLPQTPALRPVGSGMASAAAEVKPVMGDGLGQGERKTPPDGPGALLRVELRR